MRKLIWGMCCLALVVAPAGVRAEPVSFEQAANVTGLGGIEIGANVDYAYQKIEEEGLATVENTFMDIPVFLRAGIPVLEAKLTIPYGSVQNNIEAVADENYTGIRDVGFMLKTGLLTLPVVSAALGLETTFPTGDPAHYLGEGLNLYPFGALGLDLQLLKIHANLGYKYRSEYSVTVDFGSGTGTVSQDLKIKPGDAFKFAAGLEIPAGEVFSLHAELLVDSFGDAAVDGTTIPDSAGMILSVVPGVRAQAGPFKAKVGVQIPVNQASEQPDWQYAPTSDWRILGGASLQFSL